MPYISDKDRRDKLNVIVDELLKLEINYRGELNYLLFKLCKSLIKDTHQESYSNYKSYIGELEECANEIRRRFLGPLEDQKIRENGDVV